MAVSAHRREQIELARELRASGLTWSVVAATLRARYGLNGRVAMRLAHGWAQSDLATEWNRRWPDEPKTFKAISYWESWPGPTGHAPSLVVLNRLAQVCECDVADLVAGWGEHRAGDEQAAARPAGDETFTSEVDHLGVHELTRALTERAMRWPARRRHALMLKLSTAASLAAAAATAPAERVVTGAAGLTCLEGRWVSVYGYASTSRGADLEGTHEILMQIERGRLSGRSDPHPSGSELELALSVDGNLATGRWTERTSPHGHYRAATYHGVVQFVVDPTGRAMEGRWLGVSKRFTIKSGAWSLRWLGPPPPTADR